VNYVQGFTTKGKNYRITHKGDPVPRNTYAHDAVTPFINCPSVYKQYGPEYFITTNETNQVNSTSQVCVFTSGVDPNGDSLTTYQSPNGHPFYFLPQSGSGACT
jgi:hypothetical protein